MEMFWVTYSVSSTNYLSVPNSANEPKIDIFFPFPISQFLYYKAQICINYNYFVWV